MREDDSYKDLTNLFADEDASLEAAPFVARVSAGVTRRILFRRFMLAGVGLAGAVIAGLQLPQLLAEWAGIDKSINQTIVLAQTEITHTATNDPFWMAVIIGAALCLYAVSAMERA